MRASTYLTVVIVMGVSAAGPLACGGTVAVSSNSGSGGATAGSSSSESTGTSTSTATTGTATSTATSTTTTSSTTSSTTTSTTSSTTTSSGAPGATFPFPKVTFGNGPLITAPKIVTVTFPGDPMASQLEAFGDQLTASTYWQTVTSGLCGNGSTCIEAGTGSSATAGAAPGASYLDYPGGTAPAGQPANTLQPYLQSLIGALPASQQPTADTLYVFYFPTTTTLSLDGEASCAAFGGYHNSMMVGAQQVFYAIVPECSPPDAGPHLTVLEETTFAASHEVLEATTDSLIPASSQGGAPTGYYIDEHLQSSYPWLYMGDGELADLCVDQLGYGQDETTEGGYTVQRIWSIANAAAGDLDPCVPSNGKVYFNAFPTVSAVIVSAVGASTTFEVDALALGNEPEWTVAVEDITGDLFKSSTTYLSFAIAGGTTESDVGVIAATSGAKLAVTVTMIADPSKLADSPGWAQGLVLSLNGTNPNASTSGSYWPFLVMTQEQADNYGITMMDRIPSSVLARMRQRAHAALTRPGRPSFLDKVFTLGGPKALSFTP